MGLQIDMIMLVMANLRCAFHKRRHFYPRPSSAPLQFSVQRRIEDHTRDASASLPGAPVESI